MIRKKALKKIIYLLAALMVALPAFAWVYANYIMAIDTAEIDNYYNVLSKNAKPGRDLILSLGLKEGDDLRLAVDRLKSVMGFGFCNITLSYNDVEDPPGYITDDGRDSISISLSNRLKGKAEQISVLVHELGHAYVNRLDPDALAGCDNERLVDCTSAFLGLSVLTLNGLTDESLFVPGGGVETQKKFFGYLKPEQFGYLFARYVRERGLPPGRIMPFLGFAGKKYLTIGLNYIKRTGLRGAAVDSGAVNAGYWCPGCGSYLRTPLTAKIKGSKCPHCGTVI